MKISNLQNWFLSHTKGLLRQDRLMHFTAGFFLFILLSLIAKPALAIAFVLLIAISKELVYDKIIRRGNVELIDILYTIIPSIIIILANQIAQ